MPIRKIIPFEFVVPNAEIESITGVNKFGRAPSGVQTTPTDIWDRADATPTQQIWTPPTETRIHAIVSSDTNDTAAGTGARTVQVYGLTDWTTEEVSEVVTLNGLTPVNTVNPYVIIHRIKVLTCGTAGPNVGRITATAATDGTITAQINAGQGQTQMAIYGVPSGVTAFLAQYYFSIHDARTPTQSTFAEVNLLVNSTIDIVGCYVTKHTQGVSTFGAGYIRHEFHPFQAIPGPAVIKIHATASNADTTCSAGFDLYLYDRS